MARVANTAPAHSWVPDHPAGCSWQLRRPRASRLSKGVAPPSLARISCAATSYLMCLLQVAWSVVAARGLRAIVEYAQRGDESQEEEAAWALASASSDVGARGAYGAHAATRH